MDDFEYTDDQIKRAKELFKILFPNDKKESIYSTSYGRKTNTGVLNTILLICFGEPKENEVYTL